VLLVEGQDDEHVVAHLRTRSGLAYNFDIVQKGSIPADQEIGALSNVEMSWSTFGGPAADIYASVLRARCEVDGISLTPDSLAEQFRLHLHRGITYLVGNEDTKTLSGMIALATKT
jgi:DNA sulfur modification protein DndE